MFDSKYDHLKTELKWQAHWLSSDIYNWDVEEAREKSFVIDTPPPTVSGLLHMGHVFSYTQTDFVARFKRMRGFNVFYPIGFDDNGLATERLVEKIKDIKAGQMHREDFRKICEEVVEEAEEEFRGLFREIALSVDWRQEYRTVSGKVSKISQMSFIDLARRGLAERRLAPTFFDIVDRTAIAQAEIEDKEKQGVMNDIIFKTEDGEDIVIATTRPELICACVAVFYHPEDERYQHLAGKNAIAPIFGIKVPIIADHEVAIEKGTGLVMCCTFGDIQDITWWRRHNLLIKQVINTNGRMVDAGAYTDMSIKEARSKIIEDLKAAKLLIKETQITQFVKCAERSGAPLEIIPTQQWYIKIIDQKDALLEKGRACQWNPDYMRVRYENWVNGLNQDWCISRQRYFGVPFPVWYSKRAGEEGKILLAELDQLPCDPTISLPRGYTAEEVVAETDVMDTWATSSLTPQINASGINGEFLVDGERFNKLYPADLRPQAHEIIRTWSFYTIAKSLLHANSIPWKSLMISGWCLASDKTKMSKSKGNVVTPKALIVEKGADAVRYWASNSKLGVDIAYSDDVFKSGNRLITKLWNASKFVSIHLKNISGVVSTPKQDVGSGIIFEDVDLWVLSRLHQVIEQATELFEKFDYADARGVIEEFFWKDLCDNYLELIKVRIYDEAQENHKSRQSAIYCLHHVLKTIYHLFAPFMPYVTEELNEVMFGGPSVHMRGSWPKLESYLLDVDKLKMGEDVAAILELVRKYKSINNLSLKTTLAQVIYEGCNLSDSIANDLKNAANANALIKAAVGEATLASEDGKYKVKIGE
ncbi:MAG: valS [Candidatus Midichloriaceae bacterium]|jgi:valyl-tRNA synthetase|nr:valS [Candidatus Midichloriaceae bacterium]